VHTILKLQNSWAHARLLAHAAAQETFEHVKALSHESFKMQKGKASDDGDIYDPHRLVRSL